VQPSHHGRPNFSGTSFGIGCDLSISRNFKLPSWPSLDWGRAGTEGVDPREIWSAGAAAPRDPAGVIRVALAHAAHRPCLLCGGESDFAAVWVPSDRFDAVFEQWSGEKTSFGYALCEDCKSAPDVRERVESALVEKWGKR
jgi:hypothetical protein